jgi:hypothetical protein
LGHNHLEFSYACFWLAFITKKKHWVIDDPFLVLQVSFILVFGGLKVQNTQAIETELDGRLVCRDSNSLRKTGEGGLCVHTDCSVVTESNAFFLSSMLHISLLYICIFNYYLSVLRYACFLYDFFALPLRYYWRQYACLRDLCYTILLFFILFVDMWLDNI